MTKHQFTTPQRSWYSRYHAWRHAQTIHWSLFAVYVLGVLTGFVIIGGGYVQQEADAATENATVTLTSNADWNAGTLTNLDVASGAVSLTDNGWSYRDSFVVSANDATALAEYQVEMSIDTASLILAGKMQNDCDDLRFTQVESDGSETALDYYMEYGECDDAATTVWVKVEDIPASGSTTVEMYYGNGGASADSDMAATFTYDSPRTIGYLLGDDPSGYDHAVMSLIDNNVVSDGTTTLTLDTGETGTFPAADLDGATPITANGLVTIQTDASEGVMYEDFVPVSFAGTQLMFVNRYNASNPQIGLVSPWGTAAVEMYHQGVQEYSDNVTSVGASIASSQSAITTPVRVESTNGVPILATYWESDGEDNMTTVGYPATIGSFYGVPSVSAYTVFGTDTTAWSWENSGGVSFGPSLYDQDDLQGQSGSSSTGLANAFWFSGDNPINVFQGSDEDGTEGSTLFPIIEGGTLFGSANRMQYAAFATAFSGTTCTLKNSAGTTLDTDTAAGVAGIYKLHLGYTVNTFHDYAGTAWTITCDNPVVGYVELDDALPTGVDDETTLLSYQQMRQYHYPAPTVSAFAGEDSISLEPYGTYVSPSGASAIDLIWNGGWGDGTAGSTAFAATVTVPANSSIRFSMRSAASTSALASASYVTVGTATSSGTYTQTAGNLSGISTGTSRYVQIRAELLSDDASADPVLADIALTYQKDNAAPENPTATIGQASASDSTALTSGDWYNYAAPKFTWSGASDDDSGLAGYYVYFGTDDTATPSTDGSFQVGATYTAGLTSGDDGDTFYLRVQAADVGENVYTSADPDDSTLFTYSYDSTDPTNPDFITVTPAGFASENDFTFVWPTGADDDSGIAGYYSKTGETGATETLSDELSVSGIEAYQDGTNTFLVRAVDNAGNVADDYTDVSYFYSLNAPSPPRNLAVDPSSNTENSFTFSWDEPATHVGPIALYRYSINAVPTATNTTATTETTVGPDAFATQQGTNTFYVVAEDEAENISYTQYASVEFEAHTTAPGIPRNVILTDTSDRDAKRYSTTLFWDAPSSTGSGIDHYVIMRDVSDADTFVDDADLSFEQIATTSSMATIDAELDSTKRYYYRIYAEDDAGARSAGSTIVSEIPEGRYTDPPSITTNPTVSAQPFSATVSWTTGRPASSFVQFGIDSVDENEQGTADLVTDHEVTIEGLSERTTYVFRIASIDRDNNVAHSATASFTTTEAPYVTNVETQDVRLFSAIIVWETNVPVTSTVLFGPTESLGRTVDDTTDTLVTEHTAILSGLDHSTTYRFRLGGTDAHGNEVRSDLYMFSTLTYPAVTSGSVQFVNVAEGQTEVRWKTNVPTDSTVEYILGGVGNTQGTDALVTDHRVLLYNLADSTTYGVRIRGNDQFGNEAIASGYAFTTFADTTPPILSGIRSESVTRGFGDESRVQLIVAWRTNEPTTGQIEYGADTLANTYPEATDTNEELVFEHVLVVSNLDPARRYNFRILSEDKAGNRTESEGLSLLTATAKKSFLQLVIEELENTFSWVGAISGG